MTHRPHEPSPLPDDLAAGLRGLRADLTPDRDLWPAIAARLEPRADDTQRTPGPIAAPARPRRRHSHRRRNTAYAAAAAVVLAVAAGWQLLPVRDAMLAPAAPDGGLAAIPAEEAGEPLLQAADALAREYLGALREVRASSSAAGIAPPPAALDDELERRATEVRAALARDPDALHLFQRLQDIYAHRLALNLRQA